MSNTDTAYENQNRGSQSDYDFYFAGMDVTMRQKLAFTTAHFLLKPGAVIADMGCGSGLGSYQFAQLNPEVQVIGIDINPETVRIAREKYQLPNLRFEIGDIETPDPELGPFDGILNSSVLHHVYTFSGDNKYDKGHVENAIRNQFDSLKTGGMMIIRDFVAMPDDKYVFLDLKAKSDLHEESDADLLWRFSRTARPLADHTGPGFYLEEVPSTDDEWRRFHVSAKWANEFILRKDYRESWDVEILEEYSWWKAEEYRRELAALGGRVVYTAPFWNSWIVDNRYRGNIRLFEENGTPMDFPPTQYIAVVEKVAPGASLTLSEQAPLQEAPNYLSLSSHRNVETGEIYDMVARPGGVTDCLPYWQDESDRLFVLAKHGYPRPIANIVPRVTPVLDEKYWSGHMVEPISIAESRLENLPEFHARLAHRSGLEKGAFDNEAPGLNYYPSPGMAGELVTALFVPLSQPANDYVWPIPPSLSGFSEGGEIRSYAAQDLLRAAQVGILPESRLEMNIYDLMRRKDIVPDAWLGNALPALSQGRVATEELDALLWQTPRQVYAPSEQGAGYLRHIRSEFADRARGGQRLKTTPLEFVVPAKGGMNVVSILPLARDENGEVCVGLEERDLPAPQSREGDSRIMVAPAFRLPLEVSSHEGAASFIADKFNVAREKVGKLGEGFFSSVGITPERIFPYVAAVEQNNAPHLKFVSLRSVFNNLDQLRDGQLMIASLRAVHALDLWKQYRK